MAVSGWLAPVLTAALETAELAALHALDDMGAEAKARINDQRRGRLTAAWATVRANAAVLEAELAAVDVDAVTPTDDEWAEWWTRADGTLAFQRFSSQASAASVEVPPASPEVDAYGDDLALLSGGPFRDAAKPGHDLRPTVIDLANPATEPVGIAAVRALAVRLAKAETLTAATPPQPLGSSERWRRAGGETEMAPAWGCGCWRTGPK